MVATGVRVAALTWMGMLLFAPSAAANEPSGRDFSVRLVDVSETNIKPCQGVTLLWEMSATEGLTRTDWLRMTKRLSRFVRINGEEYVNPLDDSTSLNHACRFDLLWPDPVGREAPKQSAESAFIAAACQVDAKERACLFREPGDYAVAFLVEDQTLEATVHVGAPTRQERQIIERLSTVPMLLLLLDPTDFQYATPQSIAELEALADPPSAYSDMLSMTAGVAKGRRVGRPGWHELTDEDKRLELEGRYRLLEPVAKRERLTSKLEGLAASELATVTGQLARLVGETPQRVEYKDLTARLFQKVADCPLVPREQALAKQAIQAGAKNGE